MPKPFINSLFPLMERKPEPKDICEGKHGGQATSVEAFKEGEDSRAKDYQRMLELAKGSRFQGITMKDLANALNKSLNAVSGRGSEALAKGDLVKTNRKRDGCAVLKWWEFVSDSDRS